MSSRWALVWHDWFARRFRFQTSNCLFERNGVVNLKRIYCVYCCSVGLHHELYWIRVSSREKIAIIDTQTHFLTIFNGPLRNTIVKSPSSLTIAWGSNFHCSRIFNKDVLIRVERIPLQKEYAQRTKFSALRAIVVNSIEKIRPRTVSPSRRLVMSLCNKVVCKEKKKLVFAKLRLIYTSNDLKSTFNVSQTSGPPWLVRLCSKIYILCRSCVRLNVLVVDFAKLVMFFTIQNRAKKIILLV